MNLCRRMRSPRVITDIQKELTVETGEALACLPRVYKKTGGARYHHQRQYAALRQLRVWRCAAL
jgi:hypothetical protein